MKQIHTQIAIIGGGLSGLATAYFLQKQGIDFILVEARERLGGRIHTTMDADGTPIEMGATWLGPQHTQLQQLLQELSLEIYTQHIDSHAIYDASPQTAPQLLAMPQGQAPSYRIKGGSSSLIQALANQLNTNYLLTHTVVDSIVQGNGKVTVHTASLNITAEAVITTLPPRLLSTISFSPSLPEKVVAVSNQTHTWMGESIKAGFTFKRPFWRDNHGSTVFSPIGPFSELYEHSDASDKKYALKGFLKDTLANNSPKEREERALAQLEKCLGAQVREMAVAYHECSWREEAFTYIPYSSPVAPHQYNGHPVFQDSLWDGKLWLGGTETSTRFGGYMEGAIHRAKTIAKEVSLAVEQ